MCEEQQRGKVIVIKKTSYKKMKMFFGTKS